MIGERHVDRAGPENRDDGKRQHDGRKAEEDVGDPHQQQIRPAAEITGGKPYRRAEDGRDRDRDAGDRQ